MNDPREVRHAIRARRHTGHTAGLAPGHVQGNVCILPRDYADEFRAFCERNPKPCPLLAMSKPGDPRLPALGEDLDIRTDVPRYRIFIDGSLAEEADSLERYWRDDLVTFVIGCSFSFEEALMEAGLPLRYVEQGRNVPMYRTSVDTVPAPFQARRCHPRHRDHLALPARPRLAGAPRAPGSHRHRRAVAAVGRRSDRGARRRAAALLGLRRHAAIGGARGEALALHHPRAGTHAGH
jgi:hypothetical protein